MNEKTNETQLVQKAENKLEKDVRALIESIKLTNPELEDRLNVAAVVSYLQLPDTSFGWSEREGAPMPMAAKMLSIATHMKLGLNPGMGNIFYLGNSLYVTVKGVRALANQDPNWKYEEISYLPHDDDEREALGLEEGDKSIKMIAKVNVDGRSVLMQGDGILGKDELEKRDRYGKPMPGRDTKKNIAMTLKTRAERDLLNRYYPLAGISVADPAEIIDAEISDGRHISNEAINHEQRLQIQGSFEEAKRCEELSKTLLDEIKIKIGEGIPAAQMEEIIGDPNEAVNKGSEYLLRSIHAIRQLKKEGDSKEDSNKKDIEHDKKNKILKEKGLAYKTIDDLLRQKHSVEVYEKLHSLAECDLEAGDAVNIAKSVRLADKGKFEELDGILASRSNTAKEAK